MRCAANNWENFLRVDDEGNEIVPKVINKPLPDDISNIVTNPNIDNVKKPNKDEMLKMMDEMIKTYENMPQQALLQPITGYDILSFLLLLSSILRADSE